MCLPVTPFRVEREWEHAGLKCAVVQNTEGGFRCGYVRVPPSHPLHGKEYDEADVEVHGGLTFSRVEPCVEEDGTGWWFGFDCTHLGDAAIDPNPDWSALSEEAKQHITIMGKIHTDMMARMQIVNPGFTDDLRKDHFWTREEVERETESLAEQLACVEAK